MYIGSSSVLDCLKSTTVSLALLLCSISCWWGTRRLGSTLFLCSLVVNGDQANDCVLSANLMMVFVTFEGWTGLTEQGSAHIPLVHWGWRMRICPSWQLVKKYRVHLKMVGLRRFGSLDTSLRGHWYWKQNWSPGGAFYSTCLFVEVL